MPKPIYKTIMELDRMRTAESAARAKLPKPEPAPNVKRSLVFIEVGRYAPGSAFSGLFYAAQHVAENGNLKKATVKLLCDGVDMPVIMSEIETAVRKRAFK
jgi:hypothetical protein